MSRPRDSKGRWVSDEDIKRRRQMMVNSEKRLERNGVLLRGRHLPRGDQHKNESPHSTLWIDYSRPGSDLIKLRENGTYMDEELLLTADELPRLIEELIVRAYPVHADEIERRVDRTLDELRDGNEDFEFTYEL